MTKIDQTNTIARSLACTYIKNCIDIALQHGGKLIGDFVRNSVRKNLSLSDYRTNSQILLDVDKLQIWYADLECAKKFLSLMVSNLSFLGKTTQYKSFSLIEGEIDIIQVDVYTGQDYPLDDFNIDHLVFSLRGYESVCTSNDSDYLKSCIRYKKLTLTESHIAKLLSSNVLLFSENGLFDISSISISKINDYINKGWNVYLHDKRIPNNFNKSWVVSVLSAKTKGETKGETKDETQTIEHKIQREYENETISKNDFELKFKIDIVEAIKDLYSRIKELEDQLKAN